jgi:hypothetical protein
MSFTISKLFLSSTSENSLAQVENFHIITKSVFFFLRLFSTSARKSNVEVSPNIFFHVDNLGAKQIFVRGPQKIIYIRDQREGERGIDLNTGSYISLVLLGRG